MRMLETDKELQAILHSLSPDVAFALYRALISDPKILSRIRKTGLYVMPPSRERQQQGDAVTMTDFLELDLEKM